MKAIEINSITDKKGRLRLDYKIGKSQRKVRVLLLLDDDISEKEEEKLWLESISKNPAFDFLNEPVEDVYSLKDGESIDD